MLFRIMMLRKLKNDKITYIVNSRIYFNTFFLVEGWAKKPNTERPEIINDKRRKMP